MKNQIDLRVGKLFRYAEELMKNKIALVLILLLARTAVADIQDPRLMITDRLANWAAACRIFFSGLPKFWDDRQDQ